MLNQEPPLFNTIGESAPTEDFTSSMEWENPETHQKFRITVRGVDPELVRKSLGELRFELKVVPGEFERKGEEQPKERGATDNNEVVLHTDFEPIDTNGIEAPYVMQFVIDPPIQDKALNPSTRTQENYIATYSMSGSAALLVTITAGVTPASKLQAWIEQDGYTWPPVCVSNQINDCPREASTSATPNSRGSAPILKVDGLLPNNYYVLHGSAGYWP